MSLVLLIKSDQPRAELYLYQDEKIIDEYTWEAHKNLSSEILLKIKDLLTKNKVGLHDLTGAGVFAGPGSFTGLRIAHAVVNTLAYSLDIPVSSQGTDGWQTECLQALKDKPDTRIVTPEYGRPARITKQKK